MTFRRLISYVLCLAPMLPTFAQDANTRRKVGDPPPASGTGQLLITQDPHKMPTSLKHMCDLSSSIVVGTVKETLPSRETSLRSFETDAVIEISTVLKGGPMDHEIVISQRGGQKGALTVTPAQYALVHPGEQYLLFLTSDSRSAAPAVEGLKRFTVTGVWSGLFRFENNKMVVTGKRTADVVRDRYEGLTLEQITAEVNKSVNQ